MLCPGCGSDQIAVSNSRTTSRETQIWRRRKCLRCGFIYTTHEKIDLTHITVIKRSGRKVKYIGAKLYSAIYSAVAGQKSLDRGDAGVMAEKFFQKVEEKLTLLRKKEISTSEIGDIVINIIMAENAGAALRYLAYFKVDNKKIDQRKIRKYLSVK